MFGNVATAKCTRIRFHCPNGLVVFILVATGGVCCAKSSPNKPLRPQFEVLNTTKQLSLLNIKMSNPPAQT